MPQHVSIQDKMTNKTLGTVLVLTSLFFFLLSGLGVGVNLLLTLLQQFRVMERLRLYMTKTWELKEDSPWRLPHDMLLQLGVNDEPTGNVLMESAYGSIRVLVSSRVAATSTLQMSVITIHPGCELYTAKSAAVEVYQVLAGKGWVSQQGVGTTSQISVGKLWVVDPGSVRWISNRVKQGSSALSSTIGSSVGRGQADLVLLRTVDSAVSSYAVADSPLNRITMDPAHRSLSIMEQFTASVKYMSRVANEMYKKGSKANLES